MHRYRMIIAGLVGILGSPGVPGAQEVGGYGYRDGFWIGFGFGPGHAQIDCSACGSRPANDPWDGGAGYSGYLALGGTPRSNVLLGGEVALYLKETSSSERDASLGSVALVMQYYPLGDSPLFLKGGAGFGWYELVDYYYLHSFLG